MQTQQNIYTIEDLPDWRIENVKYHDVDNNKPINIDSKQQIVWEYKNQQRIKPISNLTRLPSMQYNNITPRTWVGEIIKFAKEITNGDIYITNVTTSHTNGKILVTMKIPISFESSKDDNYGMTLVAMNSYKQNSTQTLGAGAIRFACLNGCIFGDHTIETWNHRKQDETIQPKVHSVITQAVPIAKKYIENMKRIQITNTHLENPSQLDVQKNMMDLNDTASVIVMNTSDYIFPWKYKELICKTCYQHKNTISKFELWNAFTYVITHQVSDRIKYTEIAKDTMLREVNNMFETGGSVDATTQMTTENIQKIKSRINTKFQDKLIKFGPPNCKKRKK